ncbi:MAG: prepilin-type N-terminal cleavage/methylation domain-containing protein [Burkholderiales bacterium]|jgi:type II secretory pathway component PulJ
MKPFVVHRPTARADLALQAKGQSGFSLVEFLVGSAVGMILLSAGVLLWAEYTRIHHASVQQARLDHDLRTSARLIISHVRRAGYWASPQVTRLNPYAEIQLTEQGLVFHTSRDATENHQVDAHDVFGVRLKKGVLEFALGAQNWQALTDPHVLRVRSFELRPVSPLMHCARPQEGLALQLVIVAESPGGSSLTRRHESLVTLRNHVRFGACDCEKLPSRNQCSGIDLKQS